LESNFCCIIYLITGIYPILLLLSRHCSWSSLLSLLMLPQWIDYFCSLLKLVSLSTMSSLILQCHGSGKGYLQDLIESCLMCQSGSHTMNACVETSPAWLIYVPLSVINAVLVVDLSGLESHSPLLLCWQETEPWSDTLFTFFKIYRI
jgi:hypothetical protein